MNEYDSVLEKFKNMSLAKRDKYYYEVEVLLEYNLEVYDNEFFQNNSSLSKFSPYNDKLSSKIYEDVIFETLQYKNQFECFHICFLSFKEDTCTCYVVLESSISNVDTANDLIESIFNFTSNLWSTRHSGFNFGHSKLTWVRIENISLTPLISFLSTEY